MLIKFRFKIKNVIYKNKMFMKSHTVAGCGLWLRGVVEQWVQDVVG